MTANNARNLSKQPDAIDLRILELASEQSFTTMKGRARKYPAEEETEEIGRWADCLDRI